jgi:hypothetical protein
MNVDQQVQECPANIVAEPTDNDVLCGRGGSINSHPGNERFRQLVEKRKRIYLTARFKREKRLIASSIVSEIRALSPPGRFLTRVNGQWESIGDEKARDKTSQALRENAPSIRAEIETEIHVQRAAMHQEEAHHGHYANHAGYGPPPPPHAHTTEYPHYYGYASHPPPPPPPPQGYYDPHGHWITHPTYMYKTVVEQTADFVASGAEQFKDWTQSLRFSSNARVAPEKPITYTHERNKRVKFVNTTADFDDEPLSTLDDDNHTSLMSQFTNNILGSFAGSWDASQLCGYDNNLPPAMPNAPPEDTTMEHVVDEDIYWEGQEVTLVAPPSPPPDTRMPPPTRKRQQQQQHQPQGSVGLSSIGSSCHSWLPLEQFGFKSSPTASMDMHETYSASSLGGGSLTRVFEEPSPRWSASRGGSQLSVDLQMDDASFLSKSSSKLGSVGSFGSHKMAWESRE